jgi:hypothetical protein
MQSESLNDATAASYLAPTGLQLLHLANGDRATCNNQQLLHFLGDAVVFASRLVSLRCSSTAHIALEIGVQLLAMRIPAKAGAATPLRQCTHRRQGHACFCGFVPGFIMPCLVLLWRAHRTAVVQAGLYLATVS